MSVRIVDRLIDKYDNYGDWSKVSALQKARHYVEDGEYDMLEDLWSEYSGYGDWSKAGAIEELQRELGVI